MDSLFLFVHTRLLLSLSPCFPLIVVRAGLLLRHLDVNQASTKSEGGLGSGLWVRLVTRLYATLVTTPPPPPPPPPYNTYQSQTKPNQSLIQLKDQLPLTASLHAQMRSPRWFFFLQNLLITLSAYASSRPQFHTASRIPSSIRPTYSSRGVPSVTLCLST